MGRLLLVSRCPLALDHYVWTSTYLTADGCLIGSSVPNTRVCQGISHSSYSHWESWEWVDITVRKETPVKKTSRSWRLLTEHMLYHSLSMQLLLRPILPSSAPSAGCMCFMPGLTHDLSVAACSGMDTIISASCISCRHNLQGLIFYDHTHPCWCLCLHVGMRGQIYTSDFCWNALKAAARNCILAAVSLSFLCGSIRNDSTTFNTMKRRHNETQTRNELDMHCKVTSLHAVTHSSF